MKFSRNITFFLILIFLMNGCTPNSVPEGVEIFPFELMVNIYDLSNQFEHWGDKFPEIENAFSYSVSYKNKSAIPGAFFSHQITIYPNSNLASYAYPTWVTKWFTDTWAQPVESTYNPHNLEDSYKLKCMEVMVDIIPTKSCRLIQLHNNLIILVTTNISPGNINFQTFDEILIKLDARLPDGDIPMPGK